MHPHLEYCEQLVLPTVKTIMQLKKPKKGETETQLSKELLT